MKYDRYRVAVGFVAIAFCCLFAACGRAGEAPAETDLEAMSVEELRKYQGYYYASGGRDPLTMRQPTSNEMGQSMRGAGKATVAPTLEQMDKLLSEALENIMAALKNLDYAVAIKISEDTIHKLDNEWPPLKADPPQLRLMEEDIRNYNRLAIRLQAQEDIKKEFATLHLRVDGIIWSPLDAKVMVNGKTMAAGELMLNQRKQGDLRIEVIEEHGVVFQFKGMRFRIGAEMYAPLQ